MTRSDITSGNDGGNHIEEEALAREGKWGWVVVLGSLLVHIIMFGIERSSGIFFIQFASKFQQSALVIAWITTLPGGLRLLLGPFCSILVNKYSCRRIVILGAAIMSLGHVCTAFSPLIGFTFFSFAILGGLGTSMAYSPSVVIVGQYFSRRRGLAVGIATSSFGSFMFPTLIEFLFNYYGYLGAFFILAGVTLNIVVCGSLFRSLKLPTRTVNIQVIHSERQTDLPMEEAASSTLSKLSSEISVLKDHRFATFCIAIGLFSIAFHSAYAFIPVYAQEIGIQTYQATYIVAITMLSDGFGRILIGIFLDIKPVLRFRIATYNICIFCVGIACLLIPFTTTYVELSINCAIYGFLMGGVISQKSVIIADILGINKLSNAFGLLLVFQGLGVFIGPPLSGLMKDINGHSNDGFYFGGGFTMAGAIIFGIANIWYNIKKPNG